MKLNLTSISIPTSSTQISLCLHISRKQQDALTVPLLSSPLIERAQGKTPRLEALLQSLESFARYDANVGRFICLWRRPGSKANPGECLGTVATGGYRRFTVNKVRYYEHRLVWLWVTGEMPIEIGHFDKDKTNNKFDNLRDVTHKINKRNTKMVSNNTSGYTGISFAKANNKWHVRVLKKHIGYYSALEEAVAARDAYISARPELGLTARHGA